MDRKLFSGPRCSINNYCSTTFVGSLQVHVRAVSKSNDKLLKIIELREKLGSMVDMGGWRCPKRSRGETAWNTDIMLNDCLPAQAGRRVMQLDAGR